jgi:hypothetical protein
LHFLFLIFNFDSKFHFIHFHVVRFLVQDERKKVTKKKNFEKDKKLLVDNFPATKTRTVSSYQWKTGVQIG